MSTRSLRALAIAAHPDDIEIMMSGTLVLLRKAGWEIHYHTLADGCCGGSSGSRSDLIATRKSEARAGAKALGATWHPSICHDLEITYSVSILRKVVALIRKTEPNIILTHGPDDYMEDHINTGRLAVTAAFARGMKHFRSVPCIRPCSSEIAVYHSLPHTLTDQLGNTAKPTLYVDVTSVNEDRKRAISCHRSQSSWLMNSQGVSPNITVDSTAEIVGSWSKRFRLAEGWRRHSPVGLSSNNFDPLKLALNGKCF